MRNIKLIVAADEPALFFSSIEAAENKLEAIDVEDGVYTAAFGANGEPYKISSEGRRVLIRPLTGKNPKVAELRLILFKFLKAIGTAFSEEESLEDLLRKCESHLDS